MKKSFSFALKGLFYCVRAERHFRVHLAAAFYVLIASAVMHLTKTEWISVIISIGAVMGAELFNTAVEVLCDAVHPKRSTLIGFVKDMTAGAVLIFAVSSAVIGGIIFIDGEKWSRVLSFVKEMPALTVLIAATFPLAVLFIFRRYKYDTKNSHDNVSRKAERR